MYNVIISLDSDKTELGTKNRRIKKAETLRSHCYYVLQNCVKFNLHEEIKHVSSFLRNHITYSTSNAHYVYYIMVKKLDISM